MNMYQGLALFFSAAFIVLAFLAVKVMEQRDAARAQLVSQQAAIDRDLAEIGKTMDKARATAKETHELLRENNRGLAAELNRLRSARNVSWTAPAKRPSKLEIKRAFAVDDGAPLWVALNCELDSFLQDLFDQVSLPPGPSMNEEARTHLAGGIEEVRKFQKRLLDLHAVAQALDADLEGEAPGKSGGEV